jgi:hypothetical protein
MRHKRIATVALAIAASTSSAMGAYHYFLPSMFHWNEFVKGIPDIIQWALFSINFFFSSLLLAGGILTFMALRAVRRSSRADRGILFAMSGFWLLNVFYQLLIPMPIPTRLWPLHLGLVGYGIVSLLAYVVSLRATSEA